MKRNQDMRNQGWDKIAKIEAEFWFDQIGNAEMEVIWIVTTNGYVFTRDLLKGETVDDLVAHYRARRWTDANCVYYGKAK